MVHFGVVLYFLYLTTMEELRVFHITDITDEERAELERRARSQTLSHRVVRRAQMVLWNLDGDSAPEIAQRLRMDAVTVRKWLKRFRERRLPGLDELPRAGRKRMENIPHRSALARLARTPPTELGKPFATWTIERLQTELMELVGKRFSTRTLWDWLKAEGIRWQKQESWLRPVLNTPEALAEFEEKRGPSSRHIPKRKKPSKKPTKGSESSA